MAMKAPREETRKKGHKPDLQVVPEAEKPETVDSTPTEPNNLSPERGSEAPLGDNEIKEKLDYLKARVLGTGDKSNPSSVEFVEGKGYKRSVKFVEAMGELKQAFLSR